MTDKPSASQRVGAASFAANGIAFKAGGWLSVANKCGVTPESLKGHFTRGAAEAEEWLRIMRVKIAT